MAPASSLAVLAWAQALDWLLLLALAPVLVLLFRRMRYLFAKVAPVGALMTSGGPPPGQVLPPRPVRALDGTALTVGGTQPAGTRTLLLFVSGTCPISRKMLPIAQDFVRREAIALLCLGDDTDAMQHELVARFGLAPARFVNDPEIGRELGIDKLPFALLLDASGRIVAKGLVNNREHLESLVVAGETGHVSVQSYLDARPRAA
ncbi:thioredoxin domain-containing protein [Gluconacetobacter takamatsuzukensis]|uniref:Methylamine utilization protein MauD n=1 Tax=Gluconacetobacter takamatsuzukensis TaxID=1286190 RepID=A0A7W4PP80_9PROT|nr:methylamine utilization protein MauD [Gluconacetobacter takamatsuzukensis]MBB2205357.1 methylamine utilization protein MauD [Gluconacetobacter takamatsuzukensis]